MQRRDRRRCSRTAGSPSCLGSASAVVAHPGRSCQSRAALDRAFDTAASQRDRRTAVTKRGRPARSRWSRTAGERAAGGHHRRRRLALHVGVLEAEQPGRPEQPRRHPDDHPDRVQPVVARRTGPASGRGHAPRAPRTRTPPAGCRAGWRSPGRRCRRARAAPSAMSPHVQLDQGVGQVAAGVRGRVLGQLDRVHVDPGQLGGDRLGDGARAGAQLDHQRPVRAAVIIGRSRSIAQPVITSVSGRGTKTPGPTSSVEVAEVGPTGQVLQRDPRAPAA